MTLDFDADVERFRAEFVAFLAAHLPNEAEAAAARPHSSAHVPEWARRWQRVMFDNGWLQPGYPQGLGIDAASLIHVGTPAQHLGWAMPILRADITAPKHKGISVLMIPTDSPGASRRPFASTCGMDDVDFIGPVALTTAAVRLACNSG